MRMLLTGAIALAVCFTPTLRAADAAPEAPSADAVSASIAHGQEWLLAQQAGDGSFFESSDRFKLGATMVALDALIGGEGGLDTTDPRIQAAVAFMMAHVQPDGGIYDPSQGVANYNTSLALMVLSRLPDADPAVITGAQNFLIGLQNTNESDINYGGIGYGSGGPGKEDLSNTTFAMEALHESGVPADHPAMQRALQFLQRCQNLSEYNDQAWAGNDGGAAYAPHQSKAGGSWSEEEQAQAAVDRAMETNTLESYGSMTYALIKSYLYLDLAKDDPRVSAAVTWITNNYDLGTNPGMPEGQEREGLFYMYQTMAKAFELFDQPIMTLADGRVIDWRADLYAAIIERQQVVELADGVHGAFWVNDAQRWGEGLPHLVTAYVVKGLKRIHADL